MKNIAFLLLMVLLLGTFGPSSQAYANGKEQQNKIRLKDDLASKLAKSKTFETLVYKLFALSQYITLSLAVNNINGKELNQLSSQLKLMAEKKDATMDEAYEVLYLNVDKTFEIQLNELRAKLIKEFPDLSLMDAIQVEEIINNAVAKGDLVNKAIILLTKDECYENAAKTYSKCLSGNRWWSATAAIAASVCMYATFACLATASLIVTAGTTAAAVVATISGVISTCTALAFGAYEAFGITSSSCSDQNKVRLNACMSQFGSPTAGGGE